jgi:hypothetical protein
MYNATVTEISASSNFLDTFLSQIWVSDNQFKFLESGSELDGERLNTDNDLLVKEDRPTKKLRFLSDKSEYGAAGNENQSEGEDTPTQELGNANIVFYSDLAIQFLSTAYFLFTMKRAIVDKTFECSTLLQTFGLFVLSVSTQILDEFMDHHIFSRMLNAFTRDSFMFSIYETLAPYKTEKVEFKALPQFVRGEVSKFTDPHFVPNEPHVQLPHGNVQEGAIVVHKSPLKKFVNAVHTVIKNRADDPVEMRQKYRERLEEIGEDGIQEFFHKVTAIGFAGAAIPNMSSYAVTKSYRANDADEELSGDLSAQDSKGYHYLYTAQLLLDHTLRFVLMFGVPTLKYQFNPCLIGAVAGTLSYALNLYQHGEDGWVDTVAGFVASPFKGCFQYTIYYLPGALGAKSFWGKVLAGGVAGMTVELIDYAMKSGGHWFANYWGVGNEDDTAQSPHENRILLSDVDEWY